MSRAEPLIVTCVYHSKRFSECQDNQGWKSRKRALPTQTASITERWRASCGNSLVNFVFQERGKSYLRLLCGTNGERINSTHEAHRPSPNRSGISGTPLAAALAPRGALQGLIRVPRPAIFWERFGRLSVPYKHGRD